MTPAPRQNKAIQWLPYLLSVLSFVGGFYTSYVNTGSKLDQISQQVSKLSDRADIRDEATAKNTNRITALEVAVFKQPQFHTTNYVSLAK